MTANQCKFQHTKSPSGQASGGHYFFKRWVIDVLFAHDMLACIASLGMEKKHTPRHWRGEVFGICFIA